VTAFAALTEVAYTTHYKFLGAWYGAEVLLPFAHVNVQTDLGLRGTQGGMGDLIFSPLLLQWPEHKVFGKSLFQRLHVVELVVQRAVTAAILPSMSVTTWSASVLNTRSLFFLRRNLKPAGASTICGTQETTIPIPCTTPAAYNRGKLSISMRLLPTSSTRGCGRAWPATT